MATPASFEPSKSRRWLWWLLALILLFVLGFLLGRATTRCPKCPAPATLTDGGSGGGGGGGGGHPKLGAAGDGAGAPGGGGGGGAGTGRVLGDGARQDGSGGGQTGGGGTGTGEVEGGGLNNASGTTLGHGNDSSDVGGTGTDDGGSGGGGGKTRLGSDSNAPEPDPDARQTEAGVLRLAAGGTLSADGIDTPATSAKAAATKVLTARDFRYDRTNLPRYPDSVTAVVSAISYPPDGRTDTYGTSAGIVTSSPFDSVVNWYRKNLPSGWQDTTIGDFSALAQQLSPENIMQMIGSQGGESAAQPGRTGASSAPANKLKLSMFRPPAGSKVDTGVMIVQKGDQPVEAFMQANVKP